jgi:repressor LexA
MVQTSQRRRQILDFIRKFIEDKGYSPTIRDILHACNISSIAVVQHHLRVLEEQGYVSRDPHVRRSITLSDRQRHTNKVPVLGYIAAGQPIPVPQSDTWHEEPLETLELSPDMAPAGNNVYALKVRGLSMIDALIDDGDMAAVWLKAEQVVTLKKLYRERDRIRLQPASSQMEPMYHKPENVEVQGKVIGVIRNLKKPS